MKNKKTIYWVAGLIIIAGLVYFYYQNSQQSASNSQTPGVTFAQPGARCGGNMTTALSCVSGYHCAPTPGSRLPFGDVGGTCVKN